MKKHYASYELSLLAKKAGFDEKCVQAAIYYKDKLHCNIKESKTIADWKNSEMQHELSCTLPEPTHLQQWIYEKFGVWVFVKEMPVLNLLNGKIFDTGAKKYISSHYLVDFDCPYKALEAGLLEFLKQKTR